MKKCGKLFMALFIMMPLCVEAGVFKNKNISYSLNQFDLLCNDNVQQSGGIIGITEDNYFVPGIHGDIYLNKVDEDECIEMSYTDVLDFYRDDYPKSNHWTNFNTVNETIELIENGFFGLTYIDASGNDVDSNKLYYKKQPNSTLLDINNPDSFPIGSKVPDGYYEEVNYIIPDSIVINNTNTYIKMDGLISTIVDNDDVRAAVLINPENIMNYRILVELEDIQTVVKTKKYNKNIIDEMASKNYFVNFAIYNQLNDKVYFVTEDVNFENKIFDLEGNYVADYGHFSPITPTLIAAMDPVSFNINTFLSEDFEVLVKDDNISDIFPLKYDNYISYGIVSDANYNHKAYKLYEYKILSDEKVTFDGKDIKYKLSISNRVDKIYVNDKELEAKYYSIDNDNTTLIINKDYLNSLSKDTYKLIIEYVDTATNEASFIIDKDFKTENKVDTEVKQDTNNNDLVLPETPQTLDSVVSTVIVGVVSFISLVGIFMYFKKKNRIKN